MSSVYSPFSDRVGVPVYNIYSPFLPNVDVFDVSGSDTSTSTFSNHVLIGLPMGLLL